MQLVEVRKWGNFQQFIDQVLLDYPDYVWRGQRCDSWPLEPTLDRLERNTKWTLPADFREKHLKAFKFAARGRRGANPPRVECDNDWWALGQHFGLATPLLDWTSSPFTAAYFAFMGTGPRQTPRRAIYGLSLKRAEGPSATIAASWMGGGRPPIFEFVRPMSDDNPRLVNQGGLFTRAPDRTDVQTWVEANAAVPGKITLMKITVPDADRERCLRSLNRMNINHLSLFPDLFGASHQCNMAAEIENY